MSNFFIFHEDFISNNRSVINSKRSDKIFPKWISAATQWTLNFSADTSVRELLCIFQHDHAACKCLHSSLQPL